MWVLQVAGGFLEGHVPGESLSAVLDNQPHFPGISFRVIPHPSLLQPGTRRRQESLLFHVADFVCRSAGYPAHFRNAHVLQSFME
ncbi:MAG: hypothetical protein HY673_24960 [Chloroflexi bacterium]|nr:hypothetical protein [Chloroflexota bacterium]